MQIADYFCLTALLDKFYIDCGSLREAETCQSRRIPSFGEVFAERKARGHIRRRLLMSRLQIIVDQLTAARRYTELVLGQCDPANWFRFPKEGVTHIGWQVGHLAVAEYRLVLWRIRGERAGDAELIPNQFRSRYGKGSIPDPSPDKNDTAEEIRAVFDKVHKTVMNELAVFPESELDAPAQEPHPMFTTKGGGMLWCVRHEMLHTGQVGLLRRLLGAGPIW
jgi:DinB superfamily